MYHVKITDKALKVLQKIDKPITTMLLAWIEKHLEGTHDLRLKGKSLSHDKKGVWRYRIGQYRVLAHIADDELIILLVDVSHRKESYN